MANINDCHLTGNCNVRCPVKGNRTQLNQSCANYRLGDGYYARSELTLKQKLWGNPFALYSAVHGFGPVEELVELADGPAGRGEVVRVGGDVRGTLV